MNAINIFTRIHLNSVLFQYRANGSEMPLERRTNWKISRSILIAKRYCEVVIFDKVLHFPFFVHVKRFFSHFDFAVIASKETIAFKCSAILFLERGERITFILPIQNSHLFCVEILKFYMKYNPTKPIV